MTKLTLNALLVLTAFLSKAQTGVYKTFEDYQHGNIIAMDAVIKSRISPVSCTKVVFRNSQGKKQVVKSTEMWGFVFDGNLFRSLGPDIVAVLDTGKACYYEDGVIILQNFMAHSANKHVMIANFRYLSNGLNGKIYNSFDKFYKENPEFTPLAQCSTGIKIKPTSVYKPGAYDGFDYRAYTVEFRKCVHSFNSH